MEQPKIPMNAVEAFTNYEMVNGTDPLFVWRIGIDSAMARLKEIKNSLDKELIRRMKESGQSSFEITLGDEKSKVYYAKEKKEKIANPKMLVNMLKSENLKHRELAFKALAGGQAAWKVPRVRDIEKELEIDLIETSYEENIKVECVPMKILENKA